MHAPSRPLDCSLGVLRLVIDCGRLDKLLLAAPKLSLRRAKA